MSSTKIHIHNLSFMLPTGIILFDDLNLSFSSEKTALIGKNGIGKSTLLKLIMGELSPQAGAIQIEGRMAYLPQNHSLPQNDALSIADFLGCKEKLRALQQISEGSIEPDDFTLLDNDWDVESRLTKQLNAFGLGDLAYDRLLSTLSGGELTRLQLTRVFFLNADFLILDEPTNHLDKKAREQCYQAIQQWRGGLIVVSHDRALLNQMDAIIELTIQGATRYGGHYEHYVEQKTIHEAAQQQELLDAKKLIQKAKKTIQKTHERHEKKRSYGCEKRQTGSVDKMAAGAKKGRSEQTQSALSRVSDRLRNTAEIALQFAREKMDIANEIRVDLPATSVPKGKVILEITNLSFSYPESSQKIIDNLNLTLQGAERLALMGNNGSGKTTLLKLIMQELKPDKGNIDRGTPYISYLDQHAHSLNPEASLVQNFLTINPDSTENEAYRHLAQFLFRNVSAEKTVKNLSGGEKLRGLLACVLLSTHPPQLLILDEPTNHLDLTSIASIESALKCYQGAMIVISHDPVFLENIGIERTLTLERF